MVFKRMPGRFPRTAPTLGLFLFNSNISPVNRATLGLKSDMPRPLELVLRDDRYESFIKRRSNLTVVRNNLHGVPLTDRFEGSLPRSFVFGGGYLCVEGLYSQDLRVHAVDLNCL